MFTSLKGLKPSGDSLNFQKLILPCGFYLILKLFSIAIIYATFEQLFSRPFFFSGSDMVTYLTCEPTTPNILYSYSICFLNITRLADSQAITLGLFLNTAKDLAFIIIVYCITNRRVCMIFVIFLSLHPFLALSHPQYTTTVFSSISLLLVFAYDTKSTWLKTTFFSNRFLITASSILIGFRYSNAVIFLLYFVFKNYKNFYFMSFLFICTLSSFWFSWNYIYSFISYSLNAQNYILSFDKIFTLVKVTDIAVIDYFLATILYLFTHLIALTGFREAAANNFYNYFFPIDAKSVAQFILFSTFSLFHIFGVAAFCVHFRQYKGIVFCVIINILVCCLFLTHIRYFIHIIPLSLLGCSVFLDKKIITKKIH